MIEQAKFTYSPLGKPLEKQTKTIKEHGKQLIKSSGEKDSLEILKQKEILMSLLMKGGLR